MFVVKSYALLRSGPTKTDSFDRQKFCLNIYISVPAQVFPFLEPCCILLVLHESKYTLTSSEQCQNDQTANTTFVFTGSVEPKTHPAS